MDDKPQRNIISVLYILLIFSTILSFVPSVTAQIVSLAMVSFTLIAAYIYKAKDNEDGLLYNHMTYLIGTIWIGTTFIVLGMIAAGVWLYLQGDSTAFDNAVTAVSGGTMPDDAFVQNVMMSYMTTNKKLIVLSSIVAIGPAVLYFVYRVANGYGRAMKGYRIAKPKSWL